MSKISAISMPSFQAYLLSKQTLVPQVYKFIFVTDLWLPFKPGQFVSLQLQPGLLRAYSIVEFASIEEQHTHLNLPDGFFAKGLLTLLISTKPDGLASQHFETVEPGALMRIVNLTGRFGLSKNFELQARFFIATGTGLAPFIPMLKQSLQEKPNLEHKLFFGAFQRSLDFSRNLLEQELNNFSNFEIISCFDQDSFVQTPNIKMGRVTQIVPQYVTDLLKTEFYLCGNPYMIKDMQEVLQQLGVSKKQIIKESFGSVSR